MKRVMPRVLLLWFGWLWWAVFPPASVGGSLPPPPPMTFNIGVFTLFRLQSVRLVSHERPARLELGGRSLTLPPHTTYRVVQTAGWLRVWQEAHLLAEARRLSLAAGDVTVEVVGRRTRLQRRFHGRLTITPADNCLRLVVTLPLEAATAAIVSAELPVTVPREAAKALAVVVRSYLLNHLGRHAGDGFDVCDSTHCQLFLGEQWVRQGISGVMRGECSPMVAQAVEETAGELLGASDGCLYPAYFTACCGGHTTTPEVAFGTGFDAAGNNRGIVCRWCHGARFFTWVRRVDRRVLAKALLPATTPTADVQIKVASRSPQGFVRSVSVTAGTRQVVLPNYRFRHLVGQQLGWNLVLSNRYVLEPQGEMLMLRGHGFGHQVGLCLAGAIAQARAGRDYRAILKYYFPTATYRQAKALACTLRLCVHTDAGHSLSQRESIAGAHTAGS